MTHDAGPRSFPGRRGQEVRHRASPTLSRSRAEASCSSASRVRSSAEGPRDERLGLDVAARDQVDRAVPVADRPEHAEQVDVAHDDPVEVERHRRLHRRARARRPSRPAARRRRRRRSRPAPPAQRITTSIRSAPDGRDEPAARPATAGIQSPRGTPRRRPAPAGPPASRRRAPTRRPRRGRTAPRAARSARRRRRARCAPARFPRRTPCSATDAGSTSAAARAEIRTPVRGGGREHHPRRHRAVDVDDPGLGPQRAQVVAPGAAARADAAADRVLAHDLVAGREAGDARPHLDHVTDPLVPRHDRVLRQALAEIDERALEDLDVGAADADRVGRDQQLARTGRRIRARDELQPLASVELDRA